MRIIHYLSIYLLLTICCNSVQAQMNRSSPHIGYAFPAGGKQGTTLQVYVGGQSLRGAEDAYITGDGITAKVVKYYRPLRNLDRDQRLLLNDTIRKLGEQRWAELARKGLVAPTPPWGRSNPKTRQNAQSKRDEPVTLPDHPSINNLEDRSLRELLYLYELMTKGQQKAQRNPQIAELVLIEIKIDQDAIPGNRELRLASRAGITNPIIFQVGTLNEVREIERNDPMTNDPIPQDSALDLPILINGQILPGDVDRLRFNAKRGQQLVIEVHARELIPYLADAVPGWFQAVVTLYDPDGNELVSEDDYRFSPDPILAFKVRKSGIYDLEIRDSIYRGREDFVYRVSIGPQPFILEMFPIGGPSGKSTTASINGWNLSTKRVTLSTDNTPEGIHDISVHRGRRYSNQMKYEISSLDDAFEIEPNNTIPDAQSIEYPLVINGIIAETGDIDVFQLYGLEGDTIVAEIIGRRLNSPIDSLIRILDSKSNIIAWNDDYQYKDGHLHTNMGTITHHSDSYLHTRLPSDGMYYLQVSDVQNQGSSATSYRLRISKPIHDYSLLVSPSSINIPSGSSIPIDVYALRKDGFDGAIEIRLKNAPDGFTLSGTTIPPGRDHMTMTLAAPIRRFDKPHILEMEGRATVDGIELVRAAKPADNVMQAFLYRHMVPADICMAAVTGGSRRAQSLRVTNDLPIQIPSGGTTTVHVTFPANSRGDKISLELDQPPTGISIGEITQSRSSVTFELHADAALTPTDNVNNLIIVIIMEITRNSNNDKSKQETRRISLGVLPAIPIDIVAK